MNKLLFILFIFLFTFDVFPQEQDNIEKKLFLTGYMAFNIENISGLPAFQTLKNDFGANIAEASILSTYQACQNITLFSVMTYKPNFDLNKTIAELSANYSFSEAFNAKIGRFILPINPINLQYYAPMNIGISLPSFLTNHKLFPQNMNGIDISGKIFPSDNYKLQYHLIGGQYEKVDQSEEGVLGFMGREGIFMTKDIEEVQRKLANYDSTKLLDRPQYFATGANVSLDYSDMLTLGFGGFYSQEDRSIINKNNESYSTLLDNFSYGFDLAFNYNNFVFKSTLWYGNEIPQKTDYFTEKNYYIFSGEIYHTFFQQLTPYFKYERINGMAKEDRVRLISGINYRPNYEITVKFEYLRYMQSFVDDFNVYQIAFIYSF